MDDKQQAADFRKRFEAMAVPICGLLAEVEKKGFGCSFKIGVVAGKPDVSIDITKVTRL